MTNMTEDGQAATPQARVPETAVLERLRKKSSEELLVLVEQLLERKPDMEPLIELLMALPLASPAQEKNRPGKGKERTVIPPPFGAR